MQTFSDIIAAFGPHQKFSEAVGVPLGMVAVWKHRDKIPDRFWLKTVEGAASVGVPDITLELLARIAAGRLQEPTSGRAA